MRTFSQQIIILSVACLTLPSFAGISPALPRFDRFNSHASRYFVFNGERYKIANKPQIFLIGNRKFEYFHEAERTQEKQNPAQAQKVSISEFLAASKLYKISNRAEYLREFEIRRLGKTSLASQVTEHFQKRCGTTNVAAGAMKNVCLALGKPEFFESIDQYLLEKSRSQTSDWESLTSEGKLDLIFSAKQSFEKEIREGELFFDSQFKRADDTRAGIFEPGIESQDIFYPSFVIAAEQELLRASVYEGFKSIPKVHVENDIYLYAIYLKTQGIIERLGNTMGNSLGGTVGGSLSGSL